LNKKDVKDALQLISFFKIKKQLKWKKKKKKKKKEKEEEEDTIHSQTSREIYVSSVFFSKFRKKKFIKGIY
jgi:hypothetical protein